MEEVKGKLKKIIFYNDNNGYMVGLLKVNEASSEVNELVGKVITFTGILPLLNEIDTYIFKGNVTKHSKYGEQFEVKSYERILPKETDSMIDVLASEMFKGIGKKTAEKIVGFFKEDTFEVILNEPSKLLLIKGIKEKQLNILHEALVNYQGSYEDILALNKLGFSNNESMKIYNFYKELTKKIIDEDIYKVYYDLEEISFTRCDQAALRIVDVNSLIRIRGMIIYVIRTLSSSFGHTYFNQEEIFLYLDRALKISISEVLKKEALNSLIDEDILVIKDDRIYLKEYYDAEVLIARRLRLLVHNKKDELKRFDEYISKIEEFNRITYNEEQIKAIKSALVENILVITGGPGTGKTTIIKGILDLYSNYYKKSYKEMLDEVVLLAPTGRASKRMSEVTNLKASTIHRFLKWNRENNRFQINEYNKSSAKFIIIDEASMIDTLLLANLLKGLSVNCRIVFVGDVNQLPSVGPGEILKDLIESEILPVIKLKNLYRQGDDSSIISLAHNINEGIVDEVILQNKKDIEFIEVADKDIVKNIEKIAKNYSKDDLQVLVPMYKTINGIDNINKHLQNLWNKKDKNSKSVTTGEHTYYEEDKVLQLVNMPDDNVYNGDIGEIDRIKTLGKKEIYIDFDGDYVKYTTAMFNKFTLAYAISIHKSQGSEFDNVLIPLSLSYNKMLYRKLIYTAVTRCKKHLILVGDIKALNKAILNNQEQLRKTSLDLYLKDGIL